MANPELSNYCPDERDKRIAELEHEVSEWKAGSDAEAKAGDEARAKVKELERSLLLTYDTIRKGDLARQNAGGMEMQIQELEEVVEYSKTTFHWITKAPDLGKAIKLASNALERIEITK